MTDEHNSRADDRRPRESLPVTPSNLMRRLVRLRIRLEHSGVEAIVVSYSGRQGHWAFNVEFYGPLRQRIEDDKISDDVLDECVALFSKLAAQRYPRWYQTPQGAFGVFEWAGDLQHHHHIRRVEIESLFHSGF